MLSRKNNLLALIMIWGIWACQSEHVPFVESGQKGLFYHKNFVTEQDPGHIEDTSSSITITNSQGGTTSTYGLFISQIWSGNACSGSALYSSTTTAGGGFFTATSVNGSGSIIIGANFLYNMVSNALFYGQYTDSPTTSLYPGVNNSSGNSWCINIGVFGNNACHQGEACTVNNLVTVHSQSVTSIPITCNDTLETCAATSAKQQMF